MTKKIIAVDLDGTLLNSDSQISDFTKRTIKKVAEKGHQVIITTGRPYRMSKDFYRELGLDTPMINFNGSLTHLPDQVWDFEKCLTVDKKYLLDMVQRSEDIQADFIAGEYRKKFYITNPNEEIANPKLFGVEAFQPEDQFQPELVTKDPNCILLQTRASDKYALAKEVGADIVINGLEVEDVAGLIKEKTDGGAHSAVVTAVSKVAFNQAVDSIRAGGRVVAVGLPSEMMELSIVKTVLDGIQVIGSLVGTRKDLEEAFQFGAEGLVVPVVQKRPVEDAVAIFDEMEKGQIQGRMVLDFTH
ncbi:TPA: HAD-IIB family hydrolase [Streptococcus pneumoniae]